MIPALKSFDPIAAAGILARASLALEDAANPAVEPRFPNEKAVRESVVLQLRQQLGIAHDDRSQSTLELLSDRLDEECESLIGEPDADTALVRLAEKGILPSDLFDVEIVANIPARLGRRGDEETRRILETVKHPDQEQHFGPPSDPKQPFLISLFAKHFPNQYEPRSFTLLVAGQRHGMKLYVHQAWRIYPDLVDVSGAKDLIELLKRFADKFGLELQVGNERGNFILATELEPGQEITAHIGLAAAETKGTLTCFQQANPLDGKRQAALIVGIDL